MLGRRRENFEVLRCRNDIFQQENHHQTPRFPKNLPLRGNRSSHSRTPSAVALPTSTALAGFKVTPLVSQMVNN